MKKYLLVIGGFAVAYGPIAAPVFTVQPIPATNSVSLGASLTNRVSATSTNPPVTYQWRFNGVDIVGATNATLRLTNIQSTSAGVYTALAADAGGVTESRGWTVKVDATFSVILGLPIVKMSGVGGGWGDYDNDGYADLFIGTTTNNPTGNSPNKMFHNERDGTFRLLSAAEFPAAIGVMSVGFVDYDNDGWMDVYGSKIGGDVLNRNNGDGTFSKTTNSITSDIGSGLASAWGDFDNDGFVDVFVANEATPNALFRNDGRGGFVKMTNAMFNLTVYSQGASWADYDNDGLLDLFVGNYMNNKNWLYHNEGKGQFTKITTGPIVNAVGRFGLGAWADYDNDGYFDLLLGSEPNQMFHNNRDGTFTRVLNTVVATDVMHASGLTWGDYDNDGYIDILASSAGAPYDHTFLYRNNGDGTFAKVTTGSVVTDKGEGRTCEFVDYDRDGFLDIWVEQTFGTVNRFYRNNGNSNGWIEVKCEGRVSNRAGIGAKVRVTATIHGAEFRMLRQITATENVAHFGLGDATNITNIRVEWPSGIVQEFSDLPPKQFLTIREPSKLSVSTQPSGEVVMKLRGAKNCVYGITRSSDLLNWSAWLTVTNKSAEDVVDLGPPRDQGMFVYRAIEQP